MYYQVLDNLIEVNRLCHRLLSEHLGSMADFGDLMAEANRQVSAPNGRITLHVFSELTDDLIPNFCFNTTTRRFVRGKVKFNFISRMTSLVEWVNSLHRIQKIIEVLSFVGNDDQTDLL